jgi:Ca2+-binding RTX toxin-like protein
MTFVMRVSFNTDGTSDGVSREASVSADGQIAFISSATKLVAGDTNGADDGFVYNVATGGIVLAAADARHIDIAGNGRQIAFSLQTAIDFRGSVYSSSFRRDLITGATSAAYGSGAYGAGSVGVSISDDGNVVSETTRSNYLTPGKTSTFDFNTNVAFYADLGVHFSTRSSLSGDGKRFVYQRYTDGVYLHDSNFGTTRLFASGAADASISSNGLYVAYTSGNAVYRQNIATDAIDLISQSTAGISGNGASSTAVVSGDGRYIAFVSAADNLVVGDTNGVADVFVRDMVTGVTRRVSDGFSGASSDPNITADGRFLTFTNGNDVFWAVLDNTVSVVNGTIFSSMSLALPFGALALQLTGIASIDATGNAADNWLLGNAAANGLYGRAGNDHLYGYGGNDDLNGGLGADVLDGGAGFDYARYDNATTGVIARLDTGNAGTNDEATGDIYISIEGLVGSSFSDGLVGDAGDNVLVGLKGADFLYGQQGNDYLYGGDDNDHLFGGAGADVLDGGNGIDIVRYDFSTTGVTVRLDLGYGVGGEAQGDVFGNIEAVHGSQFADVIVGNAADNLVYGWVGADWLYGNGGADQLIGGLGADQYFGGLGDDAFVVNFSDMQAGVYDTINDFGFGAGNADTLYLGGFASGSYTATQSGANILISNTSLNYSGGIVVLNTTLSQLNGHVYLV